MIDLKECINWLKNGSFKKICLQIPDYMKDQSTEIILKLQKCSDALIYLIGDTVYENCCNDKLSIDHVEADACVHFGHACLSCANNLPTFYVFPKQDLETNIFCNEFQKYFQDESGLLILFYDISYAHIIENIYEQLKLNYRNLVISALNCTSNVKSTSTNNCCTSVMGRYYELPENHQIDIYDAVFLGPDDRTVMALSMSIPVKTWHRFDGLKFDEYKILNSLWLKKRRYLIEKIKDSQTFGIVIASLNTRGYLKITDMLKAILKKVNRKTYLFNVGKLSPTKLANFQEVDIFVAVTCPESSLIDSRDYYKPIVTPFEVDIAFNEARTFSLLPTIDFQQMLPGEVKYKPLLVTSGTDISLTSNKIRKIGDNESNTDNLSLTYKSMGALIKNKLNADFLQSRTWTGLEQKLGECNVNLAVDGRDGLPSNYANEHV